MNRTSCDKYQGITGLYRRGNKGDWYFELETNMLSRRFHDSASYRCNGDGHTGDHVLGGSI
jgi:hypothetical protein